jgi:2-oxoisovalerate dehydrogenase E1 component
MVVRIAGYAYQKGFGGHFHNDNSVGALLDIPGLIIASPSRADDAVTMLRTCAAAAAQAGKVCLFLEPIALYMTKDLYADGDGLWQFRYPPPEETTPLGAARVYDEAEGDRLLIVSWANGARMSLLAAARLRAEGTAVRVLDLRWLAPLPLAAVREHARQTRCVLVVDECRRTGGGPSAAILADLAQDAELRGIPLARVAAEDSYVPLGPAANTVLVQTEDIVRTARGLLEART